MIRFRGVVRAAGVDWASNGVGQGGADGSFWFTMDRANAASGGTCRLTPPRGALRAVLRTGTICLLMGFLHRD